MRKIVPTHFVKCLLRLKNIVDQIEHHKSMINRLNHILRLTYFTVGIVLSKNKSVKIQDKFFKIETVKRDNISLHKILFRAFQLHLNRNTFSHHLFLLLPMPIIHNQLLQFLQQGLNKHLLLHFFENSMRSYQSLDNLHKITRMQFFIKGLNKLLFPLLPLLALFRVVVNVDIDVIITVVVNIDVDVNVPTLLTLAQITKSQLYHLLRIDHLVRTINPTLAKHLLNLTRTGK